MSKKKPKAERPTVHEHLEGFNIQINEFGEIISNFDVERLNTFLDENVDDKKLREREQPTSDTASDEAE
jgi:hypothetical protein